ERRGGDLRRARAALAGGLAALAICVAVASGLAVSALAQSAARPEMQLGVNFFNSGDYAAAVRHFEDGVAADPSNVRARLFLATAYTRLFMAQGNFSADESTPAPLLEKARQQYEATFARDPKNISAMYGLIDMNGPANAAASRGMILKAIEFDPGRKDSY